ncbi:hypothetical protein [Streptomyces microflavus]|uniref:hypothetical protein n=1 Tax=Streptomyces microflavus TaxID=1919 RepID=UPI00366913F8
MSKGRRKSGKHAAQQFRVTTDDIRGYAEDVDRFGLMQASLNLAYDSAIIKTTVAFEKLMLESLIVTLNNDSTPFSKSTGVDFPKHIKQDHCEYLVTAGGYFDYSGRSGLLGEIKRFSGGPTHWLYDSVSKEAYYHPLELLLALRNFAAHESPQAKKKMKSAIFCWTHNVKSVKGDAAREALFAKAYAPSSAGSWLRRQGRFEKILDSLDDLAHDMEAGAPF